MYKIYSNSRIEPEDFKMDYKCSFCTSFNSKVLRIMGPHTNIFVCKGCLNNMMKALDEAMIKEIKSNKIEDRTEGGR